MASTFLTIPLRQLVPSPANPRRTRPDAGLDALENQWLQGKFAQSKLDGRGGLSGMWGVSAEDFGAALKSEAGDVLRRWFGVNVR